MSEHKYYEVVPVSEGLPEREPNVTIDDALSIDVFLLKDGKPIGLGYYHYPMEYWIIGSGRVHPSHWLRPCDDLIREVAGKAWDACENSIAFPFSNYPDKQTFIDNLLKEKL